MAADRQIPTAPPGAPNNTQEYFSTQVQEELAQLYQGVVTPLENVGGTSSVITADAVPPVSDYQQARVFLFTPAKDLGPPPQTLALNGLASQPLVTAGGASLPDGALRAGVSYILYHDGAAFRVIAPVLPAALLLENGSGEAVEVSIGTDGHYRVRITRNGLTWLEAMRADKYSGRVSFSQGVDEEVRVVGGTPQVVISDRGGGFQADAQLQFNPTFGGTTYWQHFGFVMQEWDETASPPAPTGPTVGIGFSLTSARPFYVNGSGEVADILTDAHARVRSYTVATLPSAAAAGAGSIVYVSDESGGAVLAFSDGADWRRVTDRAVVS